VVPYGSIEQVAARTSGGDNGIGQIAVVPLTEWARPTVPVVEPSEVGSMWMFPMTSRDGLARRDGFWIHIIIKQFRWGEERAMDERAPLADIMNLGATGPDGQLGFATAAVPTQLTNGIREIGRSYRLPMTTSPAANPTIQQPSPASGRRSTPAAPTSVPAPSSR
jgi:hypothetical protein